LAIEDWGIEEYRVGLGFDDCGLEGLRIGSEDGGCGLGIEIGDWGLRRRIMD